MDMLWWILGMYWAKKINSWAKGIGYKRIKVLSLIAVFIGFGTQKVKSFGDRNFLETTVRTYVFLML